MPLLSHIGPPTAQFILCKRFRSNIGLVNHIIGKIG